MPSCTKWGPNRNALSSLVWKKLAFADPWMNYSLNTFWIIFRSNHTTSLPNLPYALLGEWKQILHQYSNIYHLLFKGLFSVWRLQRALLWDSRHTRANSSLDGLQNDRRNTGSALTAEPVESLAAAMGFSGFSLRFQSLFWAGRRIQMLRAILFFPWQRGIACLHCKHSRISKTDAMLVSSAELYWLSVLASQAGT